MIGAINTMVDLSIYYVLTRFLWSPEFILVSKALSYIVATFGSFLLNRRLTFGRRDAIRGGEIIKFYSTVGLGIFVNVGVLYVTVRIFGFYDLVGAVLSALATAVWGFIFSKFYVFKK